MMVPTKSFGWLSMFSVLVIITGCTQREARFFVSGRITLDDQPVTKAVITFLPVSPSAASGQGAVALAENGRFELQSPLGLEAGQYTVHITDSIPELDEFEDKRFAGEIPIPVPTIPTRYAQSDAIQVTIEGPKSDLLFELQSGSM